MLRCWIISVLLLFSLITLSRCAFELHFMRKIHTHIGPVWLNDHVSEPKGGSELNQLSDPTKISCSWGSANVWNLAIIFMASLTDPILTYWQAPLSLQSTKAGRVGGGVRGARTFTPLSILCGDSKVAAVARALGRDTRSWVLWWPWSGRICVCVWASCGRETKQL